MATAPQQRHRDAVLFEILKGAMKEETDPALLEFRSKLRKAEELISKLGFNLKEIQEAKRHS